MIKNTNTLKKLNLTFCKTIIKSDFFLLNSNLAKHSSKFKEIFNLNTINVFELIKTIRQFIRLLQYAKEFKIKHLLIRARTWKLFSLATTFVQQYPSNFDIKVQEYFLDTTVLNASKLLLILDSKLSDNPNKDPNLIAKLLLNKFFCIQKISMDKSFSLRNNSYFIYNDLLDFKKILFVILLINKINPKKSKNL